VPHAFDDMLIDVGKPALQASYVHAAKLSRD
jgi:hypothetical protein